MAAEQVPNAMGVGGQPMPMDSHPLARPAAMRSLQAFKLCAQLSHPKIASAHLLRVTPSNL